MPTLAFCVLLFHDLCCSEGFQSPVTLSTVQLQRVRIINGTNFVGKVMSWLVETLGRNTQDS